MDISDIIHKNYFNDWRYFVEGSFVSKRREREVGRLRSLIWLRSHISANEEIVKAILKILSPEKGMSRRIPGPLRSTKITQVNIHTKMAIFWLVLAPKTQ